MMIYAVVYVGAAFGGPPDILRYCKDRHRRPLQMVRQNIGGGSFNKKGRPEGRPLALNLLNCSHIAAEPLC